MVMMILTMLGLVSPAAHAAETTVSPTKAVGAAAPHAAAVVATVASKPAGNWGWYGYRLSRADTNRIANLSFWSAVSGVKGSGLIPYSGAIMAIYSYNWVLTARNARSMGQCLAISYVGTGLIVGCGPN
jgi:hypothetical protein